MRSSFLAVALAIIAFTNAARADERAASQPTDACAEPGACGGADDSRQHFEFFPSGHIAFGMGGAASAEHPFRLGLDASFGVVATNDHGGWTLAPSLVTGFGKYPTYTSLDFGHVFFAGDGEYGAFGGLIFTVGPALRIDPNIGAGAELSARIYVLVIQLGVRAITIFTNGEEVQVEGTLGIGFM